MLILGQAWLAYALPLAVAGAAVVRDDPPVLVRRQALDIGAGISAYGFTDLTGDGRQELVAAGVDGTLRTWAGAGAAGEPPFDVEPRGTWSLARPAYTVLDLARMRGAEGGMGLIVLSPDGLALHRADAAGALAEEPAWLSRRARLSLRVGVPTFAPIVQDVNRDGRADVVVPGGQICELWLNEGVADDAPAEELPKLRLAARIRVEVERWGSHAARNLSNVLESSFAVPGLQTRDVNGDGRPDLVVIEAQRRGFHLQRADGSFPDEANVRLDLGIFRDEGAATGVKPGQSLSIEGGATFSIRDLDGDGIPDYVIAHRRKVWVFRGSSAGPQFTAPSTILKAAEDVTALTVLELDSDGHPDLLLMKLQVPTIATLVRGIIGEWDVSIQAAGYRNVGDGTFETQPKWKSSLVLRLPAIVRILKDPTSFISRFEALEERFRVARWGKLDVDGTRDLVLLSEDRTTVDVWYGDRGLGEGTRGLDADSALRELLFEEQDRVFDLDRALVWIGSLAEREVALRTGGRAPDTRVQLRSAEEAAFSSLDLADLDGDGRDELVVGYTSAGDEGRSVFDIHGVK